MKFSIETTLPEKSPSDCLVVGIYENGDFTPTAKRLDKLTRGYLTNILKKGEIQGKISQTLMLYHLPNLSIERVLLVGLGKTTELSPSSFRKIVYSSIKTLAQGKVTKAILSLAELTVEQQDTAWKVKQMVEITFDALYRFDRFKTHKEPQSALSQLTFYVDDKKALKSAEKAITQGLAIAQGVALSKNLGNLPSNICNPTYLAREAKSLAKEYSSISTKVFEERDLEKLGMGAFLAVAKGSAQDAKLICVEYKGSTKKKAPIVLVGKGITFDTGGISLKPADGMIGMKYDMCGAATVLGTLKTVAELKLPIHLIGILATAENMPSGEATKPEDIVTTLSGQTVEIMNTDAEGRLVLCDALTFAERYKPDTVIDIATLTGAVVIALGQHATGLISNHQPLADELLRAGLQSHDRAWQMPLWEEYQEQLKSPFADMSNVGGRAAGMITAGCFLSRFAKKFHWAHLDIAGTGAMMMGGNDRYATGRPVPLLTQFLLTRCKI